SSTILARRSGCSATTTQPLICSRPLTICAARWISHGQSRIHVLCDMAHLAFLRGQPRESLQLSNQARELARNIFNPRLQISLMSTRGHAHTTLSRFDETATCYSDTAKVCRESDFPSLLPEPHGGVRGQANRCRDHRAARRLEELRTSPI